MRSNISLQSHGSVGTSSRTSTRVSICTVVAVVLRSCDHDRVLRSWSAYSLTAISATPTTALSSHGPQAVVLTYSLNLTKQRTVTPMAETQLASRRTSTLLIIVLFLLFNLCYDWTFLKSAPEARRAVRRPLHPDEAIARCRSLQATPGPAADFHTRTESDRFERGTTPVLVRNARIWTGRVQGLEVFDGDILLDGGLIKAVGRVNEELLGELEELTVVDAQGYAHSSCCSCTLSERTVTVLG